MKRVYGYTRSATGETSHIQIQQMRIKDYCKTNKLKLAGIFDDDKASGSNAFQNTALNELLFRCNKKAKIEAVIVTDSDRLSRNREDYVLMRKLFERKGIELIAINNYYVLEESTPQESFVDDFMKIINEFETRLTKYKKKHQ